MTIQGAINELVNLLNADDVPIYYKGGIKKVIETIQMALADRKTETSSEKPNNCKVQTIRCPKCGRTDYIRDMEKDMNIKGSHYKYKCVNCNTYIKDEPTGYNLSPVDKDINVRNNSSEKPNNCEDEQTEPRCEDCVYGDYDNEDYPCCDCVHKDTDLSDHYEPIEQTEPSTDCSWK